MRRRRERVKKGFSKAAGQAAAIRRLTGTDIPLALFYTPLSVGSPLVLPQAPSPARSPSVCTVSPTPLPPPNALDALGLHPYGTQSARLPAGSAQPINWCACGGLFFSASLIFTCRVCVSGYSFYSIFLFLLSPFVLKRSLKRRPRGNRYSLLPHTLTFLSLFFPKFAFLLDLVCQVWASRKLLQNTDVKVFSTWFFLYNSWNSILIFNWHEAHSLCLWRTQCLNLQIFTFMAMTFYMVVYHNVAPCMKYYFMYYNVLCFFAIIIAKYRNNNYIFI